MFQRSHHFFAIAFAISLAGSIASAGPADTQTVELVATLDIHSGNVAGMRLTEQQGRDLLYLQDTYEQKLTVVDVSNAAHPKIIQTGELSVDASPQMAGSASITDKRGLTYVADQDGLTIFRKKVISSAETERDFEKRILYDR